MTVLVAAATRHGGTAGIADRIGAVLSRYGADVEVKKLQDVEGLYRYEACVVGSAVYLGNWLKPARRFLETHASELCAVPTWLFASGSVVGRPPVAEDPDALRPGLAEKLVGTTHAREHKLFGGKLDPAELGLAERLSVRMARATVGDHRDWDAVDDWAAAIAEELGYEGPAQQGY